MRALTILAALVLAMAAGAYGALVLSDGGTAVGEPFVVVPVKPPPLKNAPASAPASPSQSGAVSNSSIPANPVSAPQVVEPASGMTAMESGRPAAQAGSPGVPGLTIDASSASAPRAPALRAPMAPGGRPAGG